MTHKYGISFDWSLLTPVLILVILGLTSLFSIQFELFRNQLVFFVFSLFVCVLVSQIDLDVLKAYSLPVYIVSVILLILLLFLGTESRGAVRWFSFFGLSIQLSEIIKPFLAIAFATFLTKSKHSLKLFVSAFFLLLPIAYLIYKQPDLGNALIFTLVFVLTIFAYGFSLRYFLIGVLILAAFSPFLWSQLHGYQQERIFTFLYPAKDPMNTSYNAIQSIIAVGSGMMYGRGISQGTQSTLRFLPEKHTDFIFAKISEDLGFIGSLVIIGSLVFLFYRIFTIFSKVDDPFIKLFVACSFFFILAQSFINIGMNVGLLPVVGVTLPFVSYGGSSLLSSFIFLGFLLSVCKSLKKTDALEIGPHI